MSLIEQAKSRFKNFRDKPFRIHQDEAIEFVLASEKKFVVLEAPTGSGKSLIAMVAGECMGSLTYMVHSKVLQNQITDSFPEAMSLFGRSNYSCTLNPDLNCDECIHAKNTPCRYRGECPYEMQKRRVLAARLKILNYDYYFSEANYVGRFRNAPFIIIDEADNLENSLINFITLQFTAYAIKNLGLTPPTRKSATSKEGLYPWMELAEQAKEKLSLFIRRANEEIDSWGAIITSEYQINKIKSKSRMLRLQEKINLFIENVDDTWLFDDQQEGKYIFRPLWVTEDLAYNFLWKHGHKHVLMSASFLPKDVLAKTLGIDARDIDYMCVPSTFPTERRPIYIHPVANLTSKTMDIEVPKLVTEIKKVLNQHPNEKGLIHAVSYKLANQILNGVKNPRLMIHNSQNRQEVLKNFLDKPDPSVLISPSMERGVSLEQDLCRFIIVAKAPFLNLGDKIVSQRVWSSGKIGKDWYNAMMLLTVLQMTGRGMRSEDDHCITYILDEQFYRVLLARPTLLPDWWKDAIV